MGGFVKSVFKPVKKVASAVFGGGSGSDSAYKKQMAELEAQNKRTEQNQSQSQRKEHGQDADASDLEGMGGIDGGDIAGGLTGLGGVSQDELKLQKRKLLGG